MIPALASSALLIILAFLALMLPMPAVLGFGLLIALGFAIDTAAQRRQAAPALLAVQEG